MRVDEPASLAVKGGDALDESVGVALKSADSVFVGEPDCDMLGVIDGDISADDEGH